MKKVWMISVVSVLGALVTTSAYAAPVSTTTSACTDKVVASQTSTKSATITAGMISDRVANVSSGFTSLAPVSLGIAASTACGTTANNVALGENDTHDSQTKPGEMVDKSTGTQQGVWTGLSTNKIKKNDPSGHYSGHIHNGVVGYDTHVTPDIIAGVAVGYETVNIKTHYNSGKLEGRALTLAPYLGYRINDWLSADASIGRTSIDYTFLRDASISGKTEAVRWFGSANLTARQKVDGFILSATGGYLALNEEQQAYTESNNVGVNKQLTSFGQVRGTLKAQYPMALSSGTFVPMASMRMEYDANHARASELSTTERSTTDPVGVVFGLGADMYLTNNVTMGLTGTTTKFRKNLDVYSLSGFLRYSF
jgi:hypothetical protein